MKKMSWRLAFIGAVLLVAAAVVGGVVLAQTDEETPTPTAPTESDETATPAASATEEAATPTTPAEGDETPTAEDKETLREDFLNRLAEQLGISREQLDQALSNAALTLVDEAVADGRITEEEAARIRERIESGEGLPFFGHRRPHHGPLGGTVYGIREVAEFLGVEPEQIREGLRDGQSLAQIAEANGKSRDELKSFLTSQLQERLNEAVADGKITQERADEKLENFQERVDDLIDRTGPFPRGRWHHGPGLPSPEEPAPEPEDTAF